MEEENRPNITVVVPLYNEEESLPELAEWIAKVMAANSFTYEILMVDDGSKDDSWAVICKLAKQYPQVRGVRFSRNYGKSAALNVGFEHSRGSVVITMDADLQDSPDEIPDLYDDIANKGYDLVSGWKKKRYDPIMKTVPSKFFNWCTRKISGIHLNDFNCGLKAYRRKVVKSIEVYGEMHRYIPYIAKGAGFERIGERVVQHRARKYGKTKFGLERFINGFLDLLSIYFILRFGRRPMHFFGSLGVLSFVLGFVITFWVLAEKLVKLFWLKLPADQIREAADQPLFYLALVALVVGVQMFVTGFLGELISRSAPDRNTYLIEEKTGD